MKTTLPQRPTKLLDYLPHVFAATIFLAGWMFQHARQTAEKNAALESMLEELTASASQQAEEAFSSGDFQQAGNLLVAAQRSSAAAPTIQLLHARNLECLGQFSAAAQIYDQLETTPATRLTVIRGRKFSQRMASERTPANMGSKEQLYRLHDELMKRGDAATARLVARQLLPDTEPLCVSTMALLRKLDPRVQLEASEETGRVDVTLNKVTPQILALLQDLKIDVLNVSRMGVDDPKTLTALDVRELDLSYNRFSDLNGIRSLMLRRLDLKGTKSADLRPLAGMPLRELNLAGTLVSSLQALSLCPLEKLDLSTTAIHDLGQLRGLELRELNLSRTRVTDLAPLSGMPLETLVLSGSGVSDLRPLAGSRLKSLILSGTPVKDLTALAGMPLVELDLRDCELLTDLAPLALCPRLERVVLPRHLKAPANHWGLARLKFIETAQAVAVAAK